MRLGIGLGLFKQGAVSVGVRLFSAYKSRVIADGGTVEADNCGISALNNGLFRQASLLLIPSGYKSGKAYAEIPTNGNGDLTWTRASTALRTNSSGLLESMGSGVPRLSYMYGSCPALLLEPQRTNLALRSEEFDNASWGKTASSITTNTTTSPDGNTTADTLTGDGTSSLHGLEQSISVTSGVTYSWSIYAKKNTNNFLQIVASSGRFGSNVWANFDLDSGVIGSVGSSTTASIVNVGNGWYRCTITATATATGSAATYIINLITSSTSSRSESNTLSTSVYLWGAQFEQGAYPTTYIPTTTASATRIADSFSRNNIYTNGLITSSGGTWFVELRNNVAYTRDASGSFFIDSQNGGLGNGFNIRNVGTPNQRFVIVKYVSFASSNLYFTLTDTVKIAIKWNGTTADVFVNGTKQVSGTSFTTTNMDFFGANGNDQPKFIQQMALYPTPLSDTDCTTITTL